MVCAENNEFCRKSMNSAEKNTQFNRKPRIEQKTQNLSPGPSTRGRRQHCGARSSKAIVILRSPRGDCIALQNHSRLHSRDNLQEILAELPEFWQNSAELPEFWFQMTSCSSPEGYRFGIPQCHQIICFISLEDPCQLCRIPRILQNSGISAEFWEFC